MPHRVRIPVLPLIALLALGLLPARQVLAQGVATPSPEASPAAPPAIEAVLLAEDEVPAGLEMTEDGQRTLDEVAAGFASPEAAKEQFTAWGWRGNSVRAFHTPPGASTDPTTIDGIYISVHQFGSPEDALAALNYAVNIHQIGTELDEIEHEPLGDASVVLYGPMPYGNEVTYYVQQGDLLIRLSASSPEGDPRPVGEQLIATMLER